MKKKNKSDSEEKIVQFDAQRRKKRRHIQIRRILTLLLIAGVIVFVAMNWEWTSPAAIVRRIQTSGANKGDWMQYPLDLTQEKPLVLCGLESGGLLVTNTGYYTFGEDGIRRFSHSFSRPMVNIFDKCAALFSQDGTEYTLQSASGKLFSGSTESPLLMASCAPNGACALLTKPTDASAKLTVLSAARSELFAQTFPSSTVSTIALSQNARRVAVASALTQNGQLCSQLSVYDISQVEPVLQETVGDYLILGMSFTRSGGLRVLCDRALLLYQSTPELALKYEFPGDLDSYWLSADGYTAVLSDTGSRDAGKTAAVFYGGARLFETILPAGSSCISIYNGKTAYFCDGTVFLCDSTGAVTGKASARADVSGLCVTQNGVLVLSPNALTRLSFSDFS